MRRASASVSAIGFPPAPRAAAEAVDGDVGVRDVRRRNDDGAWLDRGEHPIEVGEPGYGGRLRDTSSVFRRIGNPDQVEPLLLQRTIDVRSADQTGADHGNGYPLHGGLSDVDGAMRHNIKDVTPRPTDLHQGPQRPSVALPTDLVKLCGHSARVRTSCAGSFPDSFPD